MKIVRYRTFYTWAVKHYFENTPKSIFEYKKLGKLIKRNKTPLNVENDKEYKRITIKLNCGGIKLRDTRKGVDIKTKRQFSVKAGQLAISRIDARNGAFGIVPNDVDGAIITGDFWAYDINQEIADIEYITLLLSSKQYINIWHKYSSGGGNRLRLQESLFLNCEVPVPPLSVQKALVSSYNNTMTKAEQAEQRALQLDKSINNILFKELGIDTDNTATEHNKYKYLRALFFSQLKEWGYGKVIGKFTSVSKLYPNVSIGDHKSLARDIYRGKSPKYSADSNAVILNQKCNRWNQIDLTHVKKVDETWLKGIDKKHFTKQGDILINSTGEGTIGRATCIANKQYENLLFDSHIILLRLDIQKVNPLFFVYLFNSKFGQSQLESIKSAQATKQTELGVENLCRYIFPLPPLDIQNQIADKIFAIKEQVKELRSSADLLRKKARDNFESELFEE